MTRSLIEKKLFDEIQQKGAIPFVEFMQQALYAPGLGYYTGGQQKFGEQGDFVTAPELSPLFSRCVARQCQQVLSALNKPIILEFGAGSGAMAAEILHALMQENALPESYWIIELSAELQTRQFETIKKKVPDYIDRVSWLHRWPERPIEGVVLANEVLDAMPVDKFRMMDALQEAFVSIKDQQFCWEWRTASERLQRVFQRYFPDANYFSYAYESEINTWIDGWVKGLSESLSKGMALLIDYGFPRHEYYHPDRTMGTLMCHYQHRAHVDPLIHVGLQDITAHVDFTAVAEAAFENELEIAGYTNQAAFLMDCGITNLFADSKNEVERLNWSNQVKRLTMPSEMGELFKVMALTRGVEEDLLGFRCLDLLGRL